MIPNANGGLHVGLCIEPTVSYSSEEKAKMLINVFWDFLEDIYFLWRENLNIIKDIIVDYEKLIKTSVKIPLNNGDSIKFTFNPQDLPHLLGLQHLVDNPILFEYSEKRLSATELYNRMCSDGDDSIDTDEFENSAYFDELYKGRIQYFSSELILDIIRAKQIVKFDYSKVKNFSTKLDKIEYMFWKKYKDKNNNYGYFGVGFMASGKDTDVNYPNTFFFRLGDDYIKNQEEVLPYSFMKKDKNGKKFFEIYWKQIWKVLEKNKHYKKLKNGYIMEDGSIDENSIKNCVNADILKHYELLQLDARDKIYLPYMKEEFRWTNDEKRYILKKIKISDRDLLPNEIKQLLNEYKQSCRMMI